MHSRHLLRRGPLVFVDSNITVPVSPLTTSLPVWAEELQDNEDAEFLLSGIADGFRITDEGALFSPVECDNYKSATCAENFEKVEQQIKTEIKEGRYVKVDQKPTIISSLGAVPKSDPGKIRLIHDCSRPLGKNLNSYASIDRTAYDTVDQATKLLPPGGFMAKIDLRSAYRYVPVHPDSYEATGLKWTFSGREKPDYFIDTRLPFGARMSPGIFQRLTVSVKRIMQRRGFVVLVYLDDMLVIAETADQCYEAFNALIALVQRLGFDINWEKVVLPCQNLTFLGVVINSVARTLALPEGKLQELRQLLSTWCSRKKATKLDLQKLLGKLNWAARVIKGGRTFVRRLIDLMCTLKCKHHHVRLNASAREDLIWWSQFLDTFNGTANFIADEPVPDHIFTSDACSTGGAAFFAGDWFYSNWFKDFPQVEDMHINLKELFAVVLATRRWAHAWKDLHIVVYTDNQTTQFLLNKGTTKNDTAMTWLREMFWWSALYNFKLSARFIPGRLNVVSDTLSRLHDRHFQRTLLQVVPMQPRWEVDGTTVVNFHGHVTSSCFAHLLDEWSRP